MQEKLLKYYQRYMYVVGFVGQLIFVFQAYKVWEMKSSADVSLLGFLCAYLSTISWSTYGFLIGNKVVARANAFGAIAGTICLCMILIYS
jgi:MtN3 and saliva related transmembrane protein